MERGYSLGGAFPRKPKVVYGPDGERLGVYHIKYNGDTLVAIVRRDCPVQVEPNLDPRRHGTFVAKNTEPFRRFK